MPDWFFKVLAVVGAVTSVFGIFLQFFFNKRLDRLKELERRQTEIEMEQLRQLFGHSRIQADQFAREQYEAYKKLWGSLYDLQTTVNSVWDNVTKQNIENLLFQLAAAEDNVGRRYYLLKEAHHQELKELFATVKSFHAGKMQLFEITRKRELEFVTVEEIEEQVSRNREYKNRLSRLVLDIGRDIRENLSAVKGRDTSGY